MPTPAKPAEDLTRRERQVMDILHRRGDSTVAEIMGDLANYTDITPAILISEMAP